MTGLCLNTKPRKRERVQRRRFKTEQYADGDRQCQYKFLGYGQLSEY